MTRAERELYDLLVSHQIDLFRLEAGERARVLSLLDRLGRDLESRLLAGGDLTAWQRSRVNALLRDTATIVDAYYTRATAEVSETLVGVARVQYQSTIFTTLLETSVPSENVLRKLADETLVLGAPAEEWWGRQATDTAFRFANEVRNGIASGETRYEIARRVSGVVDVSRRNAQSLVHSSVSAVANEARLQSYRDNDDVVSGLRQLSTLDGKTSEICAAYADQEWDLEGNPINGTTLPFEGGPPRHWNCRSVLVPIVDTKAALGFDIETGPRAAEGEQVAEQLTFSDWLSRRTPEQQDEQLGAGRAQLWRDGKITLPQLLNQQGNTLTLEQLERRARRSK